jgi:hypothetical protein
MTSLALRHPVFATVRTGSTYLLNRLQAVVADGGTF